MPGEYEPRFYFKFDISWFRIISVLNAKQQAKLLDMLDVYVLDQIESDGKFHYTDYLEQIKDDAVKVAYVAISKDLDIES